MVTQVDLSTSLNESLTTDFINTKDSDRKVKSFKKTKYTLRKQKTHENNEIFLNEGYHKSDQDSFCLNMSSSNNSSIDTMTNAPTIELVSIANFDRNAESLKNLSNDKFYTDNTLLKVNPNKFETVSLSELDNVKSNPTKLSSYRHRLKSKFHYNLINKFNQTNKFMERLVSKNGQANINRINIESRRRKYISDLFNTIVDMTWSYILAVFIMSFVVSWTFFGLLWYLISNLSADQCISNIDKNSSFFESFIFSIETQQTIGYGYRYITEECKFSLIILMIQCAFSVFLESFLGGVIFAKLSRPKKRTETLVFSKKAVIAPRDGVYNLMIRVGDLRKSHIILAHVKMYLVRTRFTAEGEYIPCDVQELSVRNLNNTDLLLFMPIIVAHKIDETSPLYEMISFSNYESPIYANKFLTNDFEILVTLEGTVESTGVTTQARTSYLPSEILWNHVFEPLLSVSFNNSKATIDFSLFNNAKHIDSLKLDNQSKRKFSIYSNFCHSNDKHSKDKKLSVPFIISPKPVSCTINIQESNQHLVNL